MSEPLDLEPIRARPAGTIDDDAVYALLTEVDRLRDEISDRQNVEADLRAQLAEAQARA